MFASRLLATSLIACQAFAGTVNDVPSCYVANRIEFKLPAPDREIFVLIDQTTLFDEKLQNSILASTWDFIRVNTAFTVVNFSAFSQGRYTEVTAAGTVEPPYPERARESTSVRLLKTFDSCMKGQEAWAKNHAVASIKTAFIAADANLAKSDILAALKDVSNRVKASRAREKVLFVASDMLENSSISSFYASSSKVRLIDPLKELAIVERAGIIGDFGGVRVVVLGAGLIGPSGDSKATYRDPKTMNALHEFWKLLFEKSNARLEQFGQPALLRPIQ